METIKKINNVERKKSENVEDKVFKYVQYGILAIFGTAVGIMIIKQIWKTLF